MNCIWIIWNWISLYKDRNWITIIIRNRIKSRIRWIIDWIKIRIIINYLNWVYCWIYF